MKISNSAFSKIKETLSVNPGRLPRIVFKKGGCAGNMIVLVLEKPEASDEFISYDGLTFAVSPNAQPFLSNISIDLQPGLCDEIIVHISGSRTCRCGRSFKV